MWAVWTDYLPLQCLPMMQEMSRWTSQTSQKLSATTVGEKDISWPGVLRDPPVQDREHQRLGQVLPGRVQGPPPLGQGPNHTLHQRPLVEVEVRNVNFVILPDTTHPLAGRRRPTNNVESFEREE